MPFLPLLKLPIKEVIFKVKSNLVRCSVGDDELTLEIKFGQLEDQDRGQRVVQQEW